MPPLTEWKVNPWFFGEKQRGFTIAICEKVTSVLNHCQLYRPTHCSCYVYYTSVYGDQFCRFIRFIVQISLSLCYKCVNTFLLHCFNLYLCFFEFSFILYIYSIYFSRTQWYAINFCWLSVCLVSRPKFEEFTWVITDPIDIVKYGPR